MQLHQKALLADTTRMAQNSAYALAFHRGLGESLNMASSVPINNGPGLASSLSPPKP